MGTANSAAFILYAVWSAVLLVVALLLSKKHTDKAGFMLLVRARRGDGRAAPP